MSNMYFTIAAFFISAFLFIVFNLKKKIKKTDNVLYNRLLIFNLLDVIFMLTVLYMGYKDIDNIKLVTLINKLDFLMYLLYGGTLLVYTCNVLKPSPQYVKGASLFAAILAMGGSLLIAILPLSLYKDANLMYAYGPAVNATFSICAIYTVVILGFIFIFHKKAKSKQMIPLYLLGIFIILILLVNRLNPGLLVIPAIISYIDLIMFFTIENPDMVMLEEIMSSKKLNEQANQEKSNMILKITDKVRNPITEISNISGYLLTKKISNEVEIGLKDIKKISDNAYDYINNALDISNSDSSALKETKTDYNINTLLSQLVLQNKDKINSNVEFRTNFSKTLPSKLYGDGVKLKQIITTVLLNSIKHTTKGFIEFNVDQVTKYDVCRLLISIEDSGTGISQNRINELLNVKEDLSPEEINKLESLDLNLNIVNKLLRLIGGTINITSEEGKGTKIDIVLDQKISKNQDKEVEKLYEYGNYEFNKKKVILISEDESYIKEFKRNATGLNINLECLNSAKECLDKIRNKEDIEIIFTEEDLSKINANDLLIKLKNEDNFNNKIVLISNCEVADQIKEYLDKGFYKVLKKNAPKKEIVDTINKLIDM